MKLDQNQSFVKENNTTTTTTTIHVIMMNSSLSSSYSSININQDEEEEEQHGIVESNTSNIRSARTTPASLLIRLAMRISRAKWFNFLRRVFHYQNGSRSHLGANPFNSGSWMVLEFVALVVQICISLITLSVSKAERPVWPMRIWVIGYDFGCVMSLFILYWRYKHYHLRQGNDGFSLPDLEQQRSHEDSRSVHVVNKCRASLDLFYAMWFVMGNVWVFDSRLGSFTRAPKLHILCITILAWNALTYSFPFLLFLLLCICVPLVSNLIGYNMSLGSAEKGASDDQLSQLRCWRFKQLDLSVETSAKENPECCICLAKYKDKEEIRQLPCSHIFHQKCVDQWLRIISCCPLCKQGLDK